MKTETQREKCEEAVLLALGTKEGPHGKESAAEAEKTRKPMLP